MVTVNALGGCSSSLALGGFTTHVSKTMMLSELSLLLEAVPHDNSSDDYRRAVLDDNVLLEKSDSTKKVPEVPARAVRAPLSGRDTTAVQKTVSGLLKLLYPNTLTHGRRTD